MREFLENQKNKINLLYIVSNRRSGSTLLELLLNSNPNLFTLGELNILPFELNKSTQLCGCGKEVKECNFWQDVIKDLKINSKTLSPFRKTHQTRKVLRFKELFYILFNKKPKGIKFEKFCIDNFKLLSSIINNIEDEDIKYLISSSKGPYRLNWLNNCENINIKVIHIIKDPRAFIYSMTKSDKGFKKVIKVFRMCLRYIIENWVISRVLRITPKDNLKVIKYEDLASDPEKIMKNISNWLKIKEEWDFNNFRNVKNHGISGNAMRFKSSKIELDEKWKRNLNPIFKFVVTCLTYFSGKKYGYFKK